MSHLLCFNLAGIYTVNYRSKSRPSLFHVASLLRQAMCCETGSVLSCQSAHPSKVQFTHSVRSQFKEDRIYAHAQYFPSKRQEKCLHILSGRKHKRTALHNHMAVCRMKNFHSQSPFFLSFISWISPNSFRVQVISQWFKYSCLQKNKMLLSSISKKDKDSREVEKQEKKRKQFALYKVRQ